MNPKLVAVCNISPESFSGDGIMCYNDKNLLQQYIQWLVDQWADMIDIWAVSTAPWAPIIDFDEEYDRLRVFFEVCGDFALPFSLDTRDARIAQLGIEAGISIINDVSAWRYDTHMIDLIAQHPQIQYVIMYSKTDHGAADFAQRSSQWNIIGEICEFLQWRVDECIGRWINRDQLILDPWMWWFVSSDPYDSVRILQSLSTIKDRFELPILVGTSRKWFLSKLVSDDVPQHRIGSSLASWLYAAEQWVDYLRVHDVKETKQMIDVRKILSNKWLGWIRFKILNNEYYDMHDE